MNRRTLIKKLIIGGILAGSVELTALANPVEKFNIGFSNKNQHDINIKGFVYFICADNRNGEYIGVVALDRAFKNDYEKLYSAIEGVWLIGKANGLTWAHICCVECETPGKVIDYINKHPKQRFV